MHLLPLQGKHIGWFLRNGLCRKIDISWFGRVKNCQRKNLANPWWVEDWPRFLYGQFFMRPNQENKFWNVYLYLNIEPKKTTRPTACHCTREVAHTSENIQVFLLLLFTNFYGQFFFLFTFCFSLFNGLFSQPSI